MAAKNIDCPPRTFAKFGGNLKNSADIGGHIGMHKSARRGHLRRAPKRRTFVRACTLGNPPLCPSRTCVRRGHLSAADSPPCTPINEVYAACTACTGSRRRTSADVRGVHFVRRVHPPQTMCGRASAEYTACTPMYAAGIAIGGHWRTSAAYTAYFSIPRIMARYTIDYIF